MENKIARNKKYYCICNLSPVECECGCKFCGDTVKIYNETDKIEPICTTCKINKMNAIKHIYNNMMDRATRSIKENKLDEPLVSDDYFAKKELSNCCRCCKSQKNTGKNNGMV